MTFSEHEFEQFNQQLLTLNELSHRLTYQQFKSQMFLFLQALIDFDSGVWVSGAKQHLVLHKLYCYELPSQFKRDWEKSASESQFLNQLLDQPGTCFIDGMVEHSAYGCGENSNLNQNCLSDYKIDKSLSIALKDPISGLFNILCLYRKEKDRCFTAKDKTIIKWLMPHLIQALKFNLFSYYFAQTNVLKNHQAIALCDSHGFLQQADKQFLVLLQHQWPQWGGSSLPSEIIDALANLSQEHSVNHSDAVFIGSKISLHAQWVEDLVFLHLRPLNKLDNLTARELTVAQFLAQGKTYKEIASQLDISPSTVNKHALSIYHKLGLNNKAELSHYVSSNCVLELEV